MAQAKIVDYNDLTELDSGRYVCNFYKRHANGSVRTDSNQLSPTWDCSFDFKFGTNWNWGSGTYEQRDKNFLSNMKLFRLWNPGSTKENCYVGMMGWEPNLHFICENMEERNHRFMSDYKQKFVLGQWHKFRFQFRENSNPGQSDGWMKITFNGDVVFERSDLMTRKNEAKLKRPYILGFDDVWDPSTSNDNPPNDFEIKNIVTSMEILGAPVEPPIEPPIDPPIDPPVGPPVDPSIMPSWFRGFIKRLGRFLIQEATLPF